MPYSSRVKTDFYKLNLVELSGENTWQAQGMELNGILEYAHRQFINGIVNFIAPRG